METNLGIYIHIPFCQRRCSYCDFLTFPQAVDLHKPYIEALLEEIQDSKVHWKNRVIDSIYIGGGSPSILSMKLSEDLLSAIQDTFPLSGDCEFSLEGNPGDFTKDKVKLYRDYGVNRISLGVQTMDQDLLKLCHRDHKAKDVYQSYELLKELGIDNINFDFIYGLPRQTIDSLKKDQKLIEDLSPSHLSFYQLILEERTLFSYWLAKGVIDLPKDEEVDLLEKRMMDFFLSKGYQRYEISNFAKEGRNSVHNLKYWQGEDYLGLGLGASSYLHPRRKKNPDHFSDYFAKKDLPWTEDSRQENLFTQFMMGLRKISGIHRKAYNKRNGEDVLELCPSFFRKKREEGSLMWDEDNFYLTEYGLKFQNLFLIDLLEELGL